MGYQLAADVVVVVHLAYLVFLALGGLLAWRWPHLIWLHVPAMAWGLVAITVGVTCPLTVVEKHFRGLAGEQGYAGGFIDHYSGEEEAYQREVALGIDHPFDVVVYPERYLTLVRLLLAAVVVAGYVGVIWGPRRQAPAPRGSAPAIGGLGG
jgi:hypothetical protein